MLQEYNDLPRKFSFILVFALCTLFSTSLWAHEKYEIINTHEHIQSVNNAPKFLKSMDLTGIQKTILVGSPEATILKGRTGFEGEEKYNDVALQLAAQYPERFRALIALDPKDPESLAKLKDYLNQGATGIKLYNGHTFFYELPLDHENMLPIYEFAEKKGIPILWHVNAGKFLAEFERVLNLYPNLKVVCPHFCLSTIKSERFEYLMDSYPNLYTDISFGMIDFLKSALLRFSKNPEKYRRLVIKYQDRILFGTDLVVTSAKYKTVHWMAEVMQVYRDLLEKKEFTFFALDGKVLNGLALESDVLEKIYQKNAERFFGLKED